VKIAARDQENLSMLVRGNDHQPARRLEMDIPDKVLVAALGLISGAIGSLIAPWVNWRIAKKKLIHDRRIKLVDEWRTFIESFDFENDRFGNTTVYAAMRPYMEAEVVRKFEAKRTFYVTSDDGRGGELFKHWASDQVGKIEKDWGLV
jgi:hypothetical protein